MRNVVSLPELTLVAPVRDLGGGFRVRRALPSTQRRMVSWFLFFDQMGPIVFEEKHGLDVRPHPHIGLATVSYLFEGEILHRDSIGNVQRITPGAVNWMTAGKGIAHSERTPPDVRARGGPISGVQLWVALPHASEEIEPSFSHTAANELPLIEDGGAQVRVVLGSVFGKKSPVPLLSEMFYAACELSPGAQVPLPEGEERALYVAEGSIEVAGEKFEPGQMLLFRPGDEVSARATAKSRLLMLGGERADGPRHMHWNFVSSSVERLEQAKKDWREQKFAKVPGETEFIPLPEDPPGLHYK
jgi:redox-sensitive bicupin YhaK (pirin superfamily)